MRSYFCSYFTGFLSPPYELMRFAASVRDAGYRVSLIDAVAESLTLTETLDKMRNYQPDVVYTLAGFESFQEDTHTNSLLKKAFSKTLFFIGGYYPSLFPEKTLKVSGADYIVKEDTISPLLKFLEAISENKTTESIPGLAYFQKDKLVNTPQKTFEKPEEQPMPAYDLIKINKYAEPLSPSPYTAIETRRGCSYRCSFCLKNQMPLEPAKPLEKILETFSILQKEHKIKSVRFLDNNLLADKSYALPLLKGLAELPNNKIKWSCMTRPENLTPKIIRLLKKAGCHRIYFGVESGSEEMLKILGKESNLEKIKSLISICNLHGLTTVGLFLFGIPGETKEDLIMTTNFAIKSGLNFINAGDLKPYPGTILFDEMKNRIDFSLSPYQLNFKDSDFNDTYIEKEGYFYRKFYFRIGFLLKNFNLLLRNPIKYFRLSFQAGFYLLLGGENIFNHLRQD